VAARAIQVHGTDAGDVLLKLMNDADRDVLRAAFRTAAVLQKREFLAPLLRHLGDARLRGEAVDALAAYGNRIIGTLGDLLDDDTVDLSIRRQIPRVMRLIPTQRSVEILMGMIGHRNLILRGGILRALNRLRETNPQLSFGNESVESHILNEAKYYQQMSEVLTVFKEYRRPRTPAGLLAATIEDRLKTSLERLFRLLGLAYPPRQIYAAYMAFQRGGNDETTAALEFLDNVLDRELKRVVVPLLEDPAHLQQRGREKTEKADRNLENVLRQLMAEGDEWLVSCAMATAAQLKLKGLAPDITNVCERSDGAVCQVAQDSALALA
jgi:ATP:ADP antiporter, AAA family